MTQTYEQVTAAENLILRHAGSVSGAVIASIQKGAIIHLDGPGNPHGYTPCHVEGWKDGDKLFAESLSMPDAGVTVNAILHQGSIFEPTGPVDVFGRTPGLVRGYVATRWTKPVIPDKQ